MMVISCKIIHVVLIREFKIHQCRNIFPLPFDGYIPDMNILIEMDGIQHFKHVDFFHRTKSDFKKRLDTDIKKSKFALKIITIYCAYRT